jgi:hypothetical protein
MAGPLVSALVHYSCKESHFGYVVLVKPATDSDPAYLCAYYGVCRGETLVNNVNATAMPEHRSRAKFVYFQERIH